MNKLLHTAFIAVFAFQGTSARATTYQRRASRSGATSKSRSNVRKHYQNLTVQANQLNAAVMDGDYAKAADLTHIRLIEMFGGRAKYMAVIENGMKGLASDSFRVISTSAGEPVDVFEVKQQIYALLPTTMEIKVPEGLLVGKTFMFGVSKDGGENWTFVAVSANENIGLLKKLFPDAAGKIRIPVIQPAVLQRETKPT